ncbi:MAG: YggS family pyridoxal phosphate-dependent enzyme [Niabella sp.]|nr:MAG: YggS family pyridoxal phosphate-dependent enzyme [Niabella sp.]
MSVNIENYKNIKLFLSSQNAMLVAVSKLKPVADINTMFQLGQKDFGENYVQELVEKEALLPKEIRWHFIGHLQSNKVKYIAPFVYLIQGVDSEKLLKEINKQAIKNNRIINVLLQMYIAQEETKFGLNEDELESIIQNIGSYKNICVKGVMGMASFSDDNNLVRKEFKNLNDLFVKLKKVSAENIQVEYLSMGMSNDYQMAVEEGSNMVRIGSLLFGGRN